MQNPGVQQPGIGPMNQMQPVSQLTQANSLSQIKPFSTGNQLPTSGAGNMSSMASMGANAAMPGMGEIIEGGKAVLGGIGNIAGSSMSKSKVDTSGIAPSAKVNSSGDVLKQGRVSAISNPSPSGMIKTSFRTGAGLITAGKDKKAALKNSNNFARRTNAQFSDQYALGGEILNPIDPIKVLATKQGILNSPVNENPLFNTKRIVKYQPGATNDKLGRGFYLYSKDNTQPGFNPNRDREFIKQSEMLAVQRTPEWKEYMRNQSIQPKQFAMGGEIDPMYYENLKLTPRNTAPIESISNLKPAGTTVPYTIGTQPAVDISNANRRFAPGPSDLDMLKYNAGKIGNYINQNAGNIARYAPIAANALQLAQLKKPQGERLDRLGNRYKPEYVDETSLQNIANQTMNNTINAISQSGASEGQIRSSILGSQLQRTKAISDAYSQAAAQNRATNDRAQTFNLGVDQVNLQQSNTEKENFAKDKGNYDTQKSKLIGQLGNDIGNVGKEEIYKKIAKNSLGYTWDGKYWNKPDGTKSTDEEVKKEIDLSKDNKKALGGYLIKNK